ncbi:MAG: malto-oligosyltrehalose synthase [Bryobacterales bacterium]|nr:malto-oligosyltrehalose synthase [Bryobacterales bacterium]
MEAKTEKAPGFRTPGSTYRIQFSPSFRFQDAWELVPYLRELGITDLYASPRAKARKGSSHGYDVADAVKINSELGTEEEFEQLVQRLKQYQMEMLLDIVPNHMAASVENPYWLDVLENGRASVYADFFDIDWQPATSKAAFLQENRILLPILGDLYGSVLTRREIVLRYDENGFFARYYDHRLPLGPKSYLLILAPGRQVLLDALASVEGKAKLENALAILAELPDRDSEETEHKIQRQHEVARVKSLLWELYLTEQEYKRALDDLLWQLSGDPQDTRSFDALDAILSAQVYRIAYWRIAVEEINYRRFFDINDLVGVRVEVPEVFEISHQEIVKLMREGKVAGVRIDHIDGLRDPLGYLRRLQGAVIGDGVESEEQHFYVLAEKILSRDERLPDWPLAGTTGYDYLNVLNGLFVSPSGLAEIVRHYNRLNGISGPFSEICYGKNKLVMDTLFANEINVIGHYLGQLAAQDRRARDIPLSEIRRILVEVTACLPVYRTYLRGFGVDQRDRDLIEATLSLARARTSPDEVSDAAFHFMSRVLLVEPPYYSREFRAKWLSVVMRWQQFSGPVMAKGLEDTAFYSYNALLSLNEVGGDPLRSKSPFDANEIHRFHAERQRDWPNTMNCTSTHDTKRSEDVRARINVLSEMPQEYHAALFRWMAANESQRTRLPHHIAPTPSEEVLIYQSLLGAWPLDEAELPDFRERFQVYVRKCAREAKEHTSWMQPNEAHEGALEQFVNALFDPSKGKAFREDFLRLQPILAFYGAINALSQVLLKATAPGLPDFYQGTELWNFSLVDPDNRRPVDFRLRAGILEELKHREADDQPALVRSLCEHWRDGRVKLFTTARTLDFRRAQAALFTKGEYIPLTVEGPRAANVFAFARRLHEQWCLVAVPLHLRGLLSPGGALVASALWDGTSVVLPANSPSTWNNEFTREALPAAPAKDGSLRLPVSAMLGAFPVALLSAESELAEPES